MNHVHFAKAALLSLAALTVACSGAEPADLGATEQQQAKSAGYGFELLPDRITDNGAPAQGGAAIPASVEGRLAPEIIRDVVRAGSAPMKACYVDALTSERGLQGEIAVRFEIREDGGVDSVKIDRSAVRNDAMIACLTGAFSALTFPTSTGGKATAIYPIEFALATAR